MEDKKLLTAGEICDFLRISLLTLKRHENNGLPHLRFGGKQSKRYLLSEVLDWMRGASLKEKDDSDVAGL